MNDSLANEQTDLIETQSTGLAFVMPDQFPDLDRAELGMRLEKQYYSGFKNPGDRIRAIFNGMDRMTTKNNGVTTQSPAICFQTKDGVYLHGGSSLVEQFKTIPPGTPVQITYLGPEKTANGNNVNKFEVRLLRVDVKAVKVSGSPEPDQPKKVEQPIPSSPGNPPPADGIVFKNDQMATDFWTQARSMGLDRNEGMAHLKEFGYDFKEALGGLLGAVQF